MTIIVACQTRPKVLKSQLHIFTTDLLQPSCIYFTRLYEKYNRDLVPHPCPVVHGAVVILMASSFPQIITEESLTSLFSNFCIEII